MPYIGYIYVISHIILIGIQSSSSKEKLHYPPVPCGFCDLILNENEVNDVVSVNINIQLSRFSLYI